MIFVHDLSHHVFSQGSVLWPFYWPHWINRLADNAAFIGVVNVIQYSTCSSASLLWLRIANAVRQTLRYRNPFLNGDYGSACVEQCIVLHLHYLMCVLG